MVGAQQFVPYQLISLPTARHGWQLADDDGCKATPDAARTWRAKVCLANGW
jgi:hypothetical protein